MKNSGPTFKEMVIAEWQKENAIEFKIQSDVIEHTVQVSARISPVVSISIRDESIFEKDEGGVKGRLVDHLYNHVYKHHKKVVDEVEKIMYDELWQFPDACAKILKLIK